MKLNKEHIEIMKHTRDRAPKGCYCGSSKEMQELVEAGLMKSLGRFLGNPYFTLTDEGRKALKTV